jgi:2-dehydro-3-deoxy-D-arabinonate dehydratase
MSSRDIEGDNPLYLPQAKMYDACCGLGPAITLAADMPAREAIQVDLTIIRGETAVFSGHTSGAEMARTFDELIAYLGRSNSFPHGAFLLTGTGIVPDSNFTLAANDEIRIDVSGIGRLVNRVAVH